MQIGTSPAPIIFAVPGAREESNVQTTKLDLVRCRSTVQEDPLEIRKESEPLKSPQRITDWFHGSRTDLRCVGCLLSSFHTTAHRWHDEYTEES